MAQHCLFGHRSNAYLSATIPKCNCLTVSHKLIRTLSKPGAIAEISIRVGVIPLNVPQRHIFLTTFLSLDRSLIDWFEDMKSPLF